MRIALISDIHGNAVSLDAVLRDIEAAAVDLVVCLGDIVLGGPAPAQCLERIIALNCPVVRGNTDEAVVKAAGAQRTRTAAEPAADTQQRFRDIARWCSRQLNDEHIQFLAGLPLTTTVDLTRQDQLLAYHGTPRSPYDPIYPTTPTEELEKLFSRHDALVYAGGHTHYQMVRRYKSSLVVNPGTVGMPFGFTPPQLAEYAIIHTEDGFLDVSLRRVPVDNEAVARAIMASDMPHREWLAAQWRGTL